MPTTNGIAREAWRAAVTAAAEKARAKFPAQVDAIDLAEQLVLAGEVELPLDQRPGQAPEAPPAPALAQVQAPVPSNGHRPVLHHRPGPFPAPVRHPR